MSRSLQPVPITAFIEIDAAMLSVVEAYTRLENDMYTRGELVSRASLERAAKRLRDAFETIEQQENSHV